MIKSHVFCSIIAGSKLLFCISLSLYSYRSSKYYDSFICSSLLLLKAIAQSKGKPIVNISKRSEQKGMTFEHDFSYSFPLFLLSPKKRGKKKSRMKSKKRDKKNMPFSIL